MAQKSVVLLHVSVPQHLLPLPGAGEHSATLGLGWPKGDGLVAQIHPSPTLGGCEIILLLYMNGKRSLGGSALMQLLVLLLEQYPAL